MLCINSFNPHNKLTVAAIHSFIHSANSYVFIVGHAVLGAVDTAENKPHKIPCPLQLTFWTTKVKYRITE